MVMNTIVEKILSIPKSIYVSLRLFPLREAIKVPCLVRYNTKLLCLKGLINVKSGVKPFMFKVGFGGVGIFDKRYERAVLQIHGIIEIEGRVYLGQGCRICVVKDATVHFGDGFINTAMMTLVCAHSIYFGSRVIVSWNTLIMDTDWHNTINTVSSQINSCIRPIHIGDKVWIGTRSIVLKGAFISNGCIVGAGAVVTKKYEKENICLAGNPATMVKDNITMYRD